MSKQLTLTHYEVSGTKIRYLDQESASAKAGSVEAIWPVETTYRIAQAVLVHSFGRWREGQITKLGRTRVTVDYQTNKQGDRRTKTFTAADVMPRP
jgi:hypothetical protein